jgi:hypothetical protein
MRVSRICTEEDAVIEGRRETLRDRRWARRRSMINVVSRWIVFLLAAGNLDAIRRFLGQVLALL